MTIRPCPPDFAVMATSMSYKALATHYKAGLTAIGGWTRESCPDRKRAKSGPPIRRPVPDDFATLALTMTSAALAEHYGASNTTIKRWVEEACPERPPMKSGPHNIKPVPPGFTTIAPTRTKAELQRYYTALATIIDRWLAETGVKPATYVSPGQPSVVPSLGRASTLNAMPIRTIHDDAANTLRRERFPVNRCDNLGRYDAKGRYWRVGTAVLTPDELLRRAQRYAA